MNLGAIIQNLFVTLVLAFPVAALAQTPTPADKAEATEEKTIAEELGFKQIFGEGMLEAYENKTIEGVYPEFAADIAAGTPPAEFTEFHHDNATTTYEHRSEEQSYTIKGIYSVKKDLICYYYNSPGKVVGSFCFYVFKRDSCYFHYHEPDGLPATAEDFENWTSMAYAREDRGTCLPSIS